MKNEFLFAGFGGQGLLFAGKILVYTGMLEGKKVSWLPSYGPEMRGGTANCSVIISDNPIGSPIVNNPDTLVAMNLPSLDKFEDAVNAGGYIFVDSTLISRKVARDDVKATYIPATQLAADNDMVGLANIIILGRAMRELGIFTLDELKGTIGKVVSDRKRALLEKNLAAVELGYNYEG